MVFTDLKAFDTESGVRISRDHKVSRNLFQDFPHGSSGIMNLRRLENASTCYNFFIYLYSVSCRSLDVSQDIRLAWLQADRGRSQQTNSADEAQGTARLYIADFTETEKS